MRKTKENLANPSSVGDSQIREAQEAENEERADALGGETSTEGVGRGFDEESRGANALEKAEATADGPTGGESSDPPNEWRANHGKTKKGKRGVRRVANRSNHAAANSSKTI